MHVLKLKAKQLVCMLLLAVICVGAMLPMVPAEAAITSVTSWYIQMSIDDQSWAVVGGVVTDEVNRIGGTPKEGMRLTSDMLSQIRSGDGISVVESFDPEEDYMDNNEVKDDLVLTYPESIGTFTGSPSTEERTQAQLVLDSLLYDINGAFSLCYDTSAIADMADYQSKMVDLLNAAKTAAGGGSTTLNGCTFRAATSADISDLATDHQTLSDYFVVEDSGGREQVFCYSMHKYADGSGLNITWDMLVAEAFINYGCGVEASGVYASDPGLLEGYVVGLFNSLVDFLSGALGLWTMDELIYNAGLRGGNSYAYGVFPTAWQSTIWTFFFICEIIAIAMLLVAIINNVLKKAASTVNPIVRANAMNQLLDIIKIVVLLVMLPLLLQIGLSLSASLASMFAGALGDQTATNRFSVLMYGSSTIGGVVMSILYLGAMIYFNAYYFLRSVIVAFLVIVAPLAVAMIGISEEKKSYYKKWQNAIIGYVAIQPIHAMILTILVIMPSTGRNIENIVAVYAMIPLGKMAKKIFLPDEEADIASKLGDDTQRKAGDLAKGAAEAAGKVGLAATAGAVGGAVAAHANNNTARMQAEDRWRDQNPDWDGNNRGGNNPGGSGGSGSGSGGSRQDTGSQNADKERDAKAAKRDEMRAVANAGGGEVEEQKETSKTGDAGASGSETGTEVTSDQAETKTEAKTTASSKAETGQADGDGRSAKQTGGATVTESQEEKDGTVQVVDTAGGKTGEDGKSVAGTGSGTQQVDDSAGQAQALADDGSEAAGDVTPEDGSLPNVVGEPVEQSEGTDPYVDAYDRQEASGKQWKDFTKDSVRDFRNPNSTLYQRAKEAAASGDHSLQNRIDSINQQHRKAGYNKLKGMAMTAAGTALFAASGRTLGRGLMQAGMNRSMYATNRQAQLRTQMMDTRMDSMRQAADVPAPAVEPPLKHRNMSDFATKASASPSGGQNLTMTKDDAAEFGMDDVFVDKQGNLNYTTNDNTDQETRENLAEMAEIFENGSEEDKEILRESGYEMVSPVYSHGEATGQYEVQTNKNYTPVHGGVQYSGTSGGGMKVRGYQQGAQVVQSVAACQDIHYENQMGTLSEQYKGVNNIPADKRPAVPKGYTERHNIKNVSQAPQVAVENAKARGVKVNQSKGYDPAGDRAKKNREKQMQQNKTPGGSTKVVQPPASNQSHSAPSGGGQKSPSKQTVVHLESGGPAPQQPSQTPMDMDDDLGPSLEEARRELEQAKSVDHEIEPDF